ncbi:hypothetical protein SZN_31839 [Streptomyces zinciresistens K42]|uniref:Nudix hydrolase domain-containing protein n=1 Tax=Streptomyces zinciresistens K42 TaxID=700597 RepID=G2GLH2_9ACTN|nr:hypothetical protein SZN_31839 [Streptomyces zinciresistens K42]
MFGREPAILIAVGEPLTRRFLRLTGQKSTNPPASPGGTVESDQGETPRQGARRETAEEIGLDREPGRLLAVDWSSGPGRPPLVAYLYDGGVLDEEDFRAIRLQEEELLSWRLVPREELAARLPGPLGRRVLAALDVLAAGSGTVELEDGRRVG